MLSLEQQRHPVIIGREVFLTPVSVASGSLRTVPLGLGLRHPRPEVRVAERARCCSNLT